MNNTLNKIMIFSAGAAIGSVVTWKVLKTKYEQIIREEVESVREAFEVDKTKGESTEELDGDLEELDNEEEIGEPSPMEQYKSTIKGAKYLAEHDDLLHEEEVYNNMDKPYVISPDDYGDPDVGYDTESLDYYEGDGVLTDSFGEIVENVDELVGRDFANHFGDYEKDSVFIRNDEMEVDYEILRDYRSYSEKDE